MRSPFHLLFICFFLQTARLWASSEVVPSVSDSTYPLQASDIAAPLVPKWSTQETSLLSKPPFSFQGGGGLSIIPLRFVFSGEKNVTTLQSGIGGHIFFRLHPLVTLNCGLFLLFSHYATTQNYWIYQLSGLLGVHIHPIKEPIPFQQFMLSPYVLISLGVNGSELMISQGSVLDTAYYVETHLGAGLEFRLRRDFSIFLEIHALFNARANAAKQNFFTFPDALSHPALSDFQVGVQSMVGLMGYF